MGEPPLKNLYLHLCNYNVDDRPDEALHFCLIPNEKAKAAYSVDSKCQWLSSSTLCLCLCLCLCLRSLTPPAPCFHSIPTPKPQV